MAKSLGEQITKQDHGMRVWQRERVIFEATERICDLMEEQDVSRTELAQRLGKNKAHVTQLLSGETNMTLKTLSDTFFALGRAVHIEDGPLAMETLDDLQVISVAWMHDACKIPPPVQLKSGITPQVKISVG